MNEGKKLLPIFGVFFLGAGLVYAAVAVSSPDDPQDAHAATIQGLILKNQVQDAELSELRGMLAALDGDTLDVGKDGAPLPKSSPLSRANQKAIAELKVTLADLAARVRATAENPTSLPGSKEVKPQASPELLKTIEEHLPEMLEAVRHKEAIAAEVAKIERFKSTGREALTKALNKRMSELGLDEAQVIAINDAYDARLAAIFQVSEGVGRDLENGIELTPEQMAERYRPVVAAHNERMAALVNADALTAIQDEIAAADYWGIRATSPESYPWELISVTNPEVVNRKEEANRESEE